LSIPYLDAFVLYNLLDNTRKFRRKKVTAVKMSAAAAAASVAAVTGVGAYLNAKYHIAQDVKGLIFKKNAAKYYAELGELQFQFAFSATTFLNRFYISQYRLT
jgi:hypothetical protein